MNLGAYPFFAYSFVIPVLKRSREMSEFVGLNTLGPGGKGEVVEISGDASVKMRITEMGMTKGVVLTVERVAPLGDPIDIMVRGYHLSLRKEEAANIMIRKI